MQSNMFATKLLVHERLVNYYESNGKIIMLNKKQHNTKMTTIPLCNRFRRNKRNKSMQDGST